MFSAILYCVVCMFVIALAAATNSAWLPTLVLISFLAGTGALWLGVLLTAREVRTSHRALQYEARRVSSLDGQPEVRTLRNAAMTQRVAGWLTIAGLVLGSCSGRRSPAPPTTLLPKDFSMVISKGSVTVPEFPDLGPAPDFNSGPWINTDTPLTLESLRGKVVLVEFWTFG